MDRSIKETVIQFGEGGFLRGFADYFFHKLQEKGLYHGKVVVVQPIEQGMCEILAEQNCRYNLFLRGIDRGNVVEEHREITSISRALNPYTQYEAYIALAENPDLRVLVSNTTEAGIRYTGTEKLTDMPPKSYPAKVCQFLYRRYQAGLRGLILLPCELIDENGDQLKKCVLQYASLWELEDGFKKWVETENDFCNTLVDRIVTGYPKDEIEELTERIGYEDKLIDTAEIFHLWAIQGNYENELPFQKAGCNIVWTHDVAFYKKRKVRILNGGHTAMALGAYLYGLETVGDCLKDEMVSSFLKKCIFEEIIPAMGDTEDNRSFGASVMERFSNPFVKHQLLSISLNSVSKFRVRVLPTILEYKERFGEYPGALTFSMAALIAFYRTDSPRDGEEIQTFMRTASVEAILKRRDYWEEDLTEMILHVQKDYDLIQEKGMREAYAAILEKASVSSVI